MTNPLLRTETVHYGAIELVVETATLLTEVEKAELHDRLNEQVVRGKRYLGAFLDVLVQTRKAKGLGFTLPTVSTQDEALLKAFEQFLKLPIPLISDWTTACAVVNVPVGLNQDLQPGAPQDNPLPSADAPSN